VSGSQDGAERGAGGDAAGGRPGPWRRIRDAVYAIVATAWVGSLWTSGYLVAPTLFATVPDRTQAGTLAGAVFAVEVRVGFVCAAVLLALRFVQSGARALREGPTRVMLAMVVIALVGHFGITPLLVDLRAAAVAREGVAVMQSTLAPRFAWWHGVSSVLFLVQSLLGAWLIAGFRARV
jgi:Domain of unknown function (DUF4149)